VEICAPGQSIASSLRQAEPGIPLEHPLLKREGARDLQNIEGAQDGFDLAQASQRSAMPSHSSLLKSFALVEEP
jgi:hypothetical protein